MKRKKRTKQSHGETAADVPIRTIRGCPENDKLYRPVDQKDASIVALAEDIRKRGILEPLVITSDRFIVSGHRRFAAAKVAGLERVPCRILDGVEYTTLSDNEVIQLLAAHNAHQRVKSVDELLREQVVQADPDASYDRLLEFRDKASGLVGKLLPEIALNGRKSRSEITDVKSEMVAAVLRVLKENREFLPMSVRQVHYNLLNSSPLRNTRRPGSRYSNDRKSYQDLSDLLLRLRLDDVVPWEYIIDETRPVTQWQCWPNVQPYFKEQLADLFMGFRRNLQASQPNYIEIIGEKNTVAGIIRPVAMQYMIPFTIGRGYCSIQPRFELAQRFRASGKDQLIVLLLSDFDPDGESIAESFARSMRDDLNVVRIVPIKVGLTWDHVKRLKLPPSADKAKPGSSQYKKFIAAYGDNVYELEAVPPAQLQELLRTAIRSVLDAEAFNREVNAEREDAAYLQTARQRALLALGAMEGAA